jgi:hypothetical protein
MNKRFFSGISLALVKHNFKKTFLISSVLLVTVIACKKENENINSPARQIAESENLVIPAEVDLPVNQPHGNTRAATYYAEGVQKYKAQAKAGSMPVTYEWVFVAPKAHLFDASNKKIGTHGAGPFWELSASDSIFAQQFSPAKTVSPDANSIAWLLLMPKTGKTATGIFANVSYIQRIATKGGKAPSVPPTSLTDTSDVFYTAIYRFSKIN